MRRVLSNEVGALMGVAQSTREAQVWLSAFKQTLQELNWIDGQNIVFDVRWPAGDLALMKSQASELVAHGSEIVLTHASPATAALRQTTANLPNVFVAVIDPVGSGFVASITRPGGNSTGFTNFEPSLSTKWLDLLKEIKPRLARVLVLANPKTFPGGFGGILPLALRAGAPSFGVAVIDTPFGASGDIEFALAQAANDSGTGMIVMPDTSTTSAPVQIGTIDADAPRKVKRKFSGKYRLLTKKYERVSRAPTERSTF